MRIQIILQIIVFVSLFSCHNEIELTSYKTIGLCDSIEVQLEKVRPTIIKKQYLGDKLIITLRTKTNCAYPDYIGAFQINSDTINLLYTVKDYTLNEKDIVYQTGEIPTKKGVFEVLCDCYVEMQYEFSDADKIKEIMLFSEQLFPPEKMYDIRPQVFDIYKNDTVNLTDSIGLKQGRWIRMDEKERITSEEFFVNDMTTCFKSINYHPNGIIKTELVRADEDYEFTYFDNGKLKRHCITKLESIKMTKNCFGNINDVKEFDESFLIEVEVCFSYNKNGKLIKKDIRIIE